MLRGRGGRGGRGCLLVSGREDERSERSDVPGICDRGSHPKKERRSYGLRAFDERGMIVGSERPPSTPCGAS